MIKLRNLDPSLRQWIQAQGIGPSIGDIRHLVPAASSSSQFRTQLQTDGVSDGDMFTTMAVAESKMTSYRNDCLIVHPGWYDETATTTWDLYDSHMLGTSAIPNQPRIDIVQTTNAFSPMTTISGRGNVFSNLTFRHGTAAADYIGCLISGRYNFFNNVYWMTPMVQAQADHTSYIGVSMTGHNNYFYGCHFGSEGTARGAANTNIKIAGSGHIFENCLFSMQADATSPVFIHIDTADDRKYTIFKNCLFFVHYVNKVDQIIYAVKITGANATTNVIFDSRCQFVGVDYVCDTTDDQHVWMGSPGDAAATALTGLAVRNLGT